MPYGMLSTAEVIKTLSRNLGGHTTQSLWNCSQTLFLPFVLRDKEHGHRRYLSLDDVAYLPTPSFVYDHVTSYAVAGQCNKF